MKYKKLSLLICSILVLSTVQSSAQNDYETAAGLRFGNQFGVSCKHFLTRDWAIEGWFAGRYRGVEFALLAEKHHDMPQLREVNWYYGGGAQMGFAELPQGDFGADVRIPTFGISGILGIEYTPYIQVPLSFALDWKPEINITGLTGFDPLVGGFSVRYILR